MIYFRDGTDAFPILSDHSILECYNLFSGVELSMRSFFVIITLNLEMRIYVHFYYCLEMRVDIHYCLPAECTSFLSMLGSSILYPGPIHAGGWM